MQAFDKTRLLESNLDRQLRWISAADAKLAFAFGVTTAMLAVLAAVAPRSAASWTVPPAIAASFATALILASLLFLSFAAFPRMKGPRGSLVFFGGIAQKELTAFKKEVGALAEESYIDDLAAQCHRNAEIANRKFAWVQRALICLYLAVIPWCVSLSLLYNAGG